ncbi:MAG: hypothetical protein JWQ72_2653, partial [Polaromonas sp.]|nr:hypothetical protein [Polaromonas sp.]
TVNVKCHRCEFSGFAQPGTKAARLILAAMKADDDAPKPELTPPTPPALRKASGLMIG